MNRILSLVIICIITATVAEATLPVRELFNANRAAMISAAKLSLSEDGVEKLQNILTRKVEQDRVVFDSAFFLKPALNFDLQRNDVSRVKKFLGIVNDSKLVEGNLAGGGRFYKESKSFRVVYSLEESVVEKNNTKAGSITGKRYYLKVMTIWPGSSSGSVKGTSEFRFDIEAAQTGNTLATLDLLKKGLDVNARDDQDGRTILMHAVWFGQLDVMRILIDKGADINAKNKKGVTALILATDKGNAELVRFLLDNGADVNAKDSLGYTALIKAAGRGLENIMSILLSKGADVNAATHDGYAALSYAAGSGHTDIVKTLIDNGADVNAKSSIGYTALMSAATSGRVDVVKVLADKGADVSAKSSSGDTALSRASKYGHPDVANLLRNAGAK